MRPSDAMLASDKTVNASIMKSVILRAFAKANVSLNITGKTDDGMHALDSVMLSLDAFDTVKVTERADGEISVAFKNADVDPIKNTAYKAARAVHDIIGGCGYDIEIVKGIPIAAGLGGSSADGAAVLRALDVFYRLPALGVDMRKIALSVGSDVPFMLTGGMARVRGKGDDLYFMGNKLELFAVGLMSEQVSTAAAYRRFDGLYDSGAFCPTDNDRLCELMMSGDTAATALFGNALYEPASELAPSIRTCVKKLEDCGATPCLTGSGGMVLGWFTDISAFAECAAKLKGERGFRAFGTAKTGILHEWINRE